VTVRHTASTHIQFNSAKDLQKVRGIKKTEQKVRNVQKSITVKYRGPWDSVSTALSLKSEAAKAATTLHYVTVPLWLVSKISSLPKTKRFRSTYCFFSDFLNLIYQENFCDKK
jgi:hypothetical protein